MIDGVITLDQIPGYLEAVEKETDARDLAFLDLTTTVCGVELVPMTMLRYARLSGVGSPFLSGGAPDMQDVMLFLWGMSADYSSDVSKRGAFMAKVFSTGKAPELEAATVEIMRFIETAFQDAPGSSSTSQGRSPSYTSWIASYVDMIASAYHWTEETILSLPLSRLWQYVRRIEMRLGQRTFWNPSDKVRGEWLRTVNEGNGGASV